MTSFTFHYDGGHGWLEVPIGTLLNVGLMPSEFSAYSYQDSRNVYLEEDVDAATFARIWETVHGAFSTTPQDDGERSFIRELPRIEPDTLDDYVSF